MYTHGSTCNATMDTCLVSIYMYMYMHVCILRMCTPKYTYREVQKFIWDWEHDYMERLEVSRFQNRLSLNHDTTHTSNAATIYSGVSPTCLGTPTCISNIHEPTSLVLLCLWELTKDAVFPPQHRYHVLGADFQLTRSTAKVGMEFQLMVIRYMYLYHF